MGKSVKHFNSLLLLSLGFLFACAWGKSEPPQIARYKDGKVFLREGDSYIVGKLPEGWKEFRTGTRAIAFHHDGYQATIFTYAQCGKRYEETSEQSLVARMLGSVAQPTTLESKQILISNREGMLKRVRGTVDGVEVQVAAVIVKKSACMFDFVLVEPSPPVDAQATSDFHLFYSGFRY